MQNNTECLKEAATPNYEAEYCRHIEIIAHLQSENTRLRETIVGMCKRMFGEGKADNV